MNVENTSNVGIFINLMEVFLLMAEKKRHVVNVYSQEISLFSSESEEYMNKLAKFVDSRMNDFAEGVSRISFGNLSILTSLSIADDYFKIKETLDNFESDKENVEDELSAALSKVMALEAISREKELRIEELEEKIEKLSTSLNSNESSREELNKKLNVLSYELKKPLEKRNYNSVLQDAYNLVNSKE